MVGLKMFQSFHCVLLLYVKRWIEILDTDFKLDCEPRKFQNILLTRATLSVALYARQMQIHGITFPTWKYSCSYQ